METAGSTIRMVEVVLIHSLCRFRHNVKWKSAYHRCPPMAKNLVGKKVMEMRQRRGWSQEELAAKCQLEGWDISRDVVAKIERQTRCVTDAELVELAGVFGISVEALLPQRRGR